MDQPKNPRLSNKIHELLAEKKMQIVDLERISGVGRRTIYDLIDGKTQKPKPAILGKLADAFEIPPTVLLNLIDKRPKKAKGEKADLIFFIKGAIPRLNEKQLYGLADFIETHFGIKKPPEIVGLKRKS